jgi:uncharacterized membrane protein YoaK (UPF0700 family)
MTDTAYSRIRIESYCREAWSGAACGQPFRLYEIVQMVMEAASPEPTTSGHGAAYAPEQSLLVASILSMSGGFLDAFTWLSLGGVFANSQTGNFVFLGMYAVLGKWQEAAQHIPPIIAFLAGAWAAARVRAPLSCLVGEIVLLAAVMVLLPRGLPGPLAIIGIAFGVALQTASFRQVERWNYLTVTVTGNMLRAVEQLSFANDPEACHGARTLLTVCLMFLLGAAVGGLATVHLAECSLVMPIAMLVSVSWLCRRHRHRPYRS